jgi:hypothetical protein
MEPAKHLALVEEAMRLVAADLPVIPLARVDTLFASRASVEYRPGVLNLTLATHAVPSDRH